MGHLGNQLASVTADKSQGTENSERILVVAVNQPSSRFGCQSVSLSVNLLQIARLHLTVHKSHGVLMVAALYAWARCIGGVPCSPHLEQQERYERGTCPCFGLTQRLRWLAWRGMGTCVSVGPFPRHLSSLPRLLLILLRPACRPTKPEEHPV